MHPANAVIDESLAAILLPTHMLPPMIGMVKLWQRLSSPTGLTTPDRGSAWLRCHFVRGAANSSMVLWWPRLSCL
ncbi:hypothetical protein Nepgr_020413 [Nepenthes gracilis]|uniref:Uncharacterized protein n=1 Tax=Nepenthes gracilis TaxID=150966 RepID=A0AAD3SY24_NEPGR|nr:hypothetical protein Nepgr_020413 [Nepenthes gracilis]